VAVAERLHLLPGDLSLSTFEDDLSEQWPHALDGKARAFRVISAFWRIIQAAAARHSAHLALIDLGPSLGAANRAALVGSDAVVVPLSPDLYSLQGLRNLGPRLRRWRAEWADRLSRQPAGLPAMPAGGMRPIGYVLQQHSVRLDRPVRAYEKWIGRVPSAYQEYVLDNQPALDSPCLAQLKHYRSLMPMAQEARKPIFLLKAADGAIGAHYQAVQDVGREFKMLATEILRRLGVPLPPD
jgi:chromosome partitioning protein